MRYLDTRKGKYEICCKAHKHLQSQLVSINLYQNIGDAAPLCIEVQYPQYNEVVIHRHPQYQYHHGRQHRHRSLASWTVEASVGRTFLTYPMLFSLCHPLIIAIMVHNDMQCVCTVQYSTAVSTTTLHIQCYYINVVKM